MYFKRYTKTDSFNIESNKEKTKMKNIDKKITELSPCLIDLCNSRYDEIESLKGWSKNLESKIVKLKGERDSLVQLANDRFDVIENLQEIVDQYTNDPKNKSLADEVIKLKTENQKLEFEIKELKTHLRLISNLSNYEKLGYKK